MTPTQAVQKVLQQGGDSHPQTFIDLLRDEGFVLTAAAEVEKSDFAPVMGIRLRKDGPHTVVDAEVGGTWIEVIRELSGGEFCHIVEASGIMSAYYQGPAAAEVDKP